MEFTASRYMVNGIEMNVVIAGQGPDVLLVHGFPDTHQVWRHQIPALVEAGYRVIAPDTRGCGESQLMSRVADYHIENLIADLAALLDVLKIEKVKLVAHDWGAVIAWQFVMAHPQRVERYLALSVGHPSAYGSGGIGQKLKGYYIVLFQLRYFAEWLLKLFNWKVFRLFTGFADELPHWREALSRPGRLTAGINYYRANLQLILPRTYPHVTVPVTGIYSDGDRFLTEAQMTSTAQYCDAGFRYQKVSGANHWLQLDAPEKVTPLILDALH
ncbi:MAG: alpha/beta fold hydrolase [Rhodocyclaceae bacterium]|nr:alpha/beta fold hydrolase [Rhodocyclaceae bacterium]